MPLLFKRTWIIILLAAIIVYFTAEMHSADAGTKKNLLLIIPLYAAEEQIGHDYIAQLNQYISNNDILVLRGEPKFRKLG
jgi:hypothetical protein